ncbi:MAG: DUF262 domain-containing HNH endonuclease family protein [Gemmatimonadota bacterium]|nr:DUF262 domain-containing HNH endonuclease family protein [Gemmatimonadota bacterium]
MEANTRTLQDVLHGDRRFVVPVYQRPYVWEPERQWEPLWNDIEATLTRLAEVRRSAHERQAPASEADKNASPHFLGAVVLEQYPTPTGDIDMRSVVDGQQRLITLQLLLLGTLDALDASGVTGPMLAKLRKLTRNDTDIVSGDALHKVWPRPAERGDYLRAVASDAPPEDNSVFAAARTFFSNAAAEFLEDEGAPEDPYTDGPPAIRQASLLVSTLLGLVKVVVIDLEDVDDAQIIFEALNARNTPLSAMDLVKNLLFMRARAEGHDPEALYTSVWHRFDKDEAWWRQKTGAGHARRARQDWLLGDWLIAQLGRIINVGRLYGEFRQWLDTSGTDPVQALVTLNSYADAYESIHGRKDGATETERQSFSTIDRLNITVATPVLLWLLTEPEERIPQQERAMAFKAIESFVVRRMAVRWQTRGYSRAFAELLGAAQKSDLSPGRAIVRALRQGPYGYSWPTDEELVRRFRKSRYYGAGGINQDRLRLLLGAVDRELQRKPSKSEPVKIEYDQLEVEHVIPQSWRKYWPVEAAGSDAHEKIVLEQEREAHVHLIGNLTLTTERLNNSLSNDPWKEKCRQLKKHSRLCLNTLLCENSRWNEEEIEKRGEWLAKRVACIWLGPDAESWE